MPNEQNPNPASGQESDISKAQSHQQPAGAELTGDQAATGQAQADAGPDEGPQGEAATQRRTDIGGGSLQSGDEDEAGTGFVGSKGEGNKSSELIDEQDFSKDGQGAPEGN